MTTQQFEAVISKSGSKVLVKLPFDPNAVWGEKTAHYITGSVNGCTVRGALGVDEQGHFLPLGPAWRRDNSLDVGSQVTVTLSPEGPQVDALAADIAEPLRADPQARAFFEGLATFYRSNFIKWIEGAKRAETRAARIAEMITLLQAGKREK